MGRREVVTHRFVGGRFNDHGVVLDALSELIAYKELLHETAKELWRRRNPDRQRLPKNFDEGLSLKFYEVRDGSVAIPLWREDATWQSQIWEDEDDLDKAIRLIASAINAASEDRMMPEEFPKSVLPLFMNYGATLRSDEYIEQLATRSGLRAKYTAETRERLMHYAAITHEGDIDIIATVTMANIRVPRVELLLDDGHRVEAAFTPDQEEIITTALKEHASARIRVQGKAAISDQGILLRVAELNKITLLPAGHMPLAEEAKPIWEVFLAAIPNLPLHEVSNYPTDGAEEHDHYIYGSRRRRANPPDAPSIR